MGNSGSQQLIDDAPPADKVPKSGGNTVAVFMAIIAALGPLTFGYTLGFTSPSNLPMMVGPTTNGSWVFEAVFGGTTVNWNDAHTLGAVSSTEASLFGSIVNVGAALGALVAAPLADGAGRKLAIASSALPFIAAWLLIGLDSSFAAILAGRLLSGVAVGVVSMAVPVYISETAPASLRGALGAVNQFAVTGGILLVYLCAARAQFGAQFGAQFSPRAIPARNVSDGPPIPPRRLGYALEEPRPTTFACTDATGANTCPFGACAAGVSVCETMLAPWRVLALVGAGVAALLLLCAVLLLPETPNHLVAKGKTTAARRVLARLRSSATEADDEFEALMRKHQAGASVADGASENNDNEMANPVGEAAEKRAGGVRALFAPGVRRPFFVGCMLMVFQQFSGINAVIFFSSSILQSGGIDDPNEGGLIVMAVQVVMTGVAVLLMDRAGRRLLLLVSLGGMTIFAGALAAFHYNGAKPAWLALTSLVGYIVFFSLGLGAIPWLIMGEIFPGHVRALAASAATLLNWCLSFIVTESFASLLSALGPANTFTTFAAVCAVGVGFVALCVPETKGKTFEEIEALFR